MKHFLLLFFLLVAVVSLLVDCGGDKNVTQSVDIATPPSCNIVSHDCSHCEEFHNAGHFCKHWCKRKGHNSHTTDTVACYFSHPPNTICSIGFIKDGEL